MREAAQRPLLQWMGRMLARFVGVIFVLYGALLFFGNLFGLIGGNVDAPWWAILWVLASGALAMAGGVFFILTFDGPGPWRAKRRRATAVALMMLSSFVPSTVGAITFVFAVLAVPSIWVRGDRADVETTDG